LRRWGEQAIGVGLLTIADIKDGDPAACTLLSRAARRLPTPISPRDGHTSQEILERAMAHAIAMRRR
jgi:hypothetical protein